MSYEQISYEYSKKALIENKPEGKICEIIYR